MPNNNQRPVDKAATKKKLLANRRLVFDEFEFFPQQQKLLYKGTICQLEPKMLQLLQILIEQRPKLVTKQELMNKLWPDAVVSDWSLARLVSDTRKLIEDDGKQQSIIKTVRGKGFSFAANVDEIIQTYQGDNQDNPAISNVKNGNAEPAKSKPQTTGGGQPPSNRAFFNRNLVTLLVTVLAALIAAVMTYRAFFWEKPEHDVQGHRLEVMYEIQKNLRLTKTTYLAQKRRRNELKASLIAKSPEKTPLSSERRIRLHYPHLTSEERFIFDQIRAMTEGPMYQGNTQILRLLNQHPELFREIETFQALYNHLSIWKSKYERVFVHQPDMCFVFVGEEDGVPFPSEIDGLVDDWINLHSTVD